MGRQNHYGPYTARPGKSGPPWLLYLLIAAGLLAAGGGLCYALAPEAVGRLYGRFFGPELLIQSLTVQVDRRVLEIGPGGALEMHPRQNFTVQGLKSNRLHNYDLRLYSPDVDIARVSGGASATPLDLLGEAAIAEAAARLRIEVREGDEPRAVFEIRPLFTAVDLAALAEAADDPARRADLYQKAFALNPSSRPLREKLAEALIAAQRREEAAAIYEEDFLSDGPSQALLSRLLTLYTEMGADEKIISTLKRLIELARTEKRDRLPYQRALADLYQKMKRLAEAVATYEEMIGEAPDDEARAALLRDLLALYRELGGPEQEIATLKCLLEITPQERSALIWSDIIALHERLNDVPAQTAAWLSLAEILPDGLNKANAYKRAAYLLAGAEQYAGATEAYEAALALDAADINVHLNLGRLALAQNDRAGYRDFLAKALELAPERADLRRELAEALYEDRLMAEAEAEYEKILADSPDDQNSRLRLIAIIEDGEGQEDRLMAEYAKLLAAQPDNKVAAYNLAVLNFRGEKWGEAIAAFKKVLALDGEDLDARGYLFSAYEKQGETENMLNEALEIYRRDTGRAEYRELLINSYENAADWPRLLTVAEELTRLLPRDVEAWQLLARVQANLAKPVDSARSLYKAAEAAADKPEQWLAAAEALNIQNQIAPAKAAYEKVLELEPENKRAAEGLLDVSLRELSGGGASSAPTF